MDLQYKVKNTLIIKNNIINPAPKNNIIDKTNKIKNKHSGTIIIKAQAILKGTEKSKKKV